MLETELKKLNAVLERIATAMEGGASLSSPDEAPEQKAEKPAAKDKPKPKKDAKAPAKTPAKEKTDDEKTDHDRDDIRALVRSTRKELRGEGKDDEVETHKTAFRALLDEGGFSDVNEVPDEDVSDFYDKVAAIEV